MCLLVLGGTFQLKTSSILSPVHVSSLSFFLFSSLNSGIGLLCSGLFSLSVSSFMSYFLDNFWTSFSSSLGKFCVSAFTLFISKRTIFLVSKCSHFIASCSCFEKVAS